jgi:hypothetical protein
MIKHMNNSDSERFLRERQHNLEGGVERDNAIDVLERLGQKFPDLKHALLAFLTTASVIPTPQTAFAEEAPGGPVTEQQSLEEVLSQLKDKRGKDFFMELCQKVDAVDGAIPEGALYGRSYNYAAVNDGFRETEGGSDVLPEEAHNVVVHNHYVDGDCGVFTNAAGKPEYSTQHVTKRLFYVQPGPEQHHVEGEPFESTGFGSTKGEALRNALEDAAIRIGASVEGALMFIGGAVVYDVVYTSNEHFLKEYKVIRVAETKEDQTTAGSVSYEVMIEIVPGLPPEEVPIN